MQARYAIIIILTCITVAVREAEAKHLTVCIEDSFWAPNTFMVRERAAGIHVEMMRRAAVSAGYTLHIKRLPWLRCLGQAEDGDVDAVLSATYQADRAQYMYYPDDAQKEGLSFWRFSEAEELVVVRVDSTFEWSGERHLLPQPVGSKAGYRITKGLREGGLMVVDTDKDDRLFDMLLRERVHSLVAPRGLVEHYLRLEPYRKQLRTFENPITVISYFLPVSKKSSLTKQQAQGLWKAIASVREDVLLMQQITSETEAKLALCRRNPEDCR